jgi:hypothetical protein
MEFLVVLALETGSLGWQRLEDRGLGERLRPPEFLIYRVGEEIVAHIPRYLGSGETF